MGRIGRVIHGVFRQARFIRRSRGLKPTLRQLSGGFLRRFYSTWKELCCVRSNYLLSVWYCNLNNSSVRLFYSIAVIFCVQDGVQQPQQKSQPGRWFLFLDVFLQTFSFKFPFWIQKWRHRRLRQSHFDWYIRETVSSYQWNAFLIIGTRCSASV